MPLAVLNIPKMKFIPEKGEKIKHKKKECEPNSFQMFMFIGGPKRPPQDIVAYLKNEL